MILGIKQGIAWQRECLKDIQEVSGLNPPSA